jgi:Lrp/AsnC family transcriptional regulator for asnA, asnC and gidA
MTKLTDVDYQIISLLQEDGRMPTVEIARRIGVSEGTVRRRLTNLVNDEVMRVTAVVNPFKLGFPFKVRFALIIEIDKFTKVAQALAALKEVRFAHFLSGSHDILAEGWFKTMDEVVNFVVNDLSTIDGVQKIETFYVQKEIKRSHFHDQDLLNLLAEGQ